MKRRNILCISVWYPSRAQPLDGIFVREQARAVQRYDNVVVLHCAGFDRSLRQAWRLRQEPDASLTAGIPTYRVWYQDTAIPRLRYFTYIRGVWQAVHALLAQGFRPDILHAHVYEAGVPAVLFGKRYGIPVVLTEHFSGFPRRLLRRIDVWKARLAFGGADVVVPVSRALQRAIEAYGIRARFQVIPNVVDLGATTARSASCAGADRKRLLFVGWFDPSHVKGVPVLLRALAQLQQQRDDWTLDLVGDGPNRAAYERLAADLGLADRMVFHGSRPRQEVLDLMRRADLFVLASLTETFSVATAEALALGTPVLATRCGGPEEFVSDAVGILVPPGDVAALGAGLASMLDRLATFDRGQIAQYAQARFGPERVGALLHAVYGAIVEG